MKKRLFLAAFAAVALCGGFTSCGSDDEPVQPAEQSKAITATLSFSSAANTDFKKVANIVMSYEIVNGMGTQKQENFYIKEDGRITDIECPCTVTIKFKPELDEDAQINADSVYNLQCGPFVILQTNEAPYQFIKDVHYYYDVKGSELKDLFKQIGTETKVTYSVLKDGSIQKK